MKPASDRYDGGIGGPGIWDQMPLVPPTTTPQEVSDPDLIWSKPKLTKKPGAKRTRNKTTATKKSATKKAAKKRRTTKKKMVGRSKKRR